MNKIILAVAALSLHAVLGACSSDDDSSGGTRAEAIAACKKVCAKQKDCTPEINLDCDSLCTQSAPSEGSDTSCDIPALKAKVDQCVAGTCEALPGCYDDLDALCPGEPDGTGGSGSGTGGSGSGTGGSGSGTGGAGQGTGCSVCDDAFTCCLALNEQTGGEPGDCDGLSAAECSASGQESLFAESCSALLQSGAGLGIPACQ